MAHGKQLVKLGQIGAYEPVLFIELSELRFEFPEIKARQITLPSVSTGDLASSADWECVADLLKRVFLVDELAPDQIELIWDNRYLCRDVPDSLPLVLSCCPEWNTETLGDVSGMLTIWPLISPLVALRLLSAEFASIQTARQFATKCIFSRHALARSFRC